MKIIFLFTLVLVAILPTHLLAHEGHVHEPAVEAPLHGGLLRDAGPFKSEVVLNGDQAKLFIYDKSLKPVKLDQKTLKGDFQFPRDKKARPVKFTLNGDHYVATLPGVSKVHRFDLHVNLIAGGKKGLGDFGIDNVQ